MTYTLRRPSNSLFSDPFLLDSGWVCVVLMLAVALTGQVQVPPPYSRLLSLLEPKVQIWMVSQRKCCVGKGCGCREVRPCFWG